MPEREEKEERQGLLSGESLLPDERKSGEESRFTWPRKALLVVAFCTLGFLLALVIGPRCWSRNIKGSNTRNSTAQEHEADSLMFNGTHSFKPTVLMVSIDGLRADYLDRGLTSHLLEISRVGLRAKWMKPIFPVRNPL